MKSVLKFLAPYRKAIVSGLVAVGVAAYPVLADGHLSYAEFGILVGAFVTGSGLTYKVPNAPLAEAKHKAGS